MEDKEFREQLKMMETMREMGKFYACIADVHGEISELERVLASIEAWRKYNKVSKDNLQYVFLGDFIDRGPEPRAVIMKVKEYVDNGAICLLGNHDAFLVGTGDMSMTTFENGKFAYHSHLWSINHGWKTCVQLYGARPTDIEPFRAENSGVPMGEDVNVYRDRIRQSEEYQFLKNNAKLFHETDAIFFSHAPQSSNEYTNNSLIWGRQSDYSNPKGDGCFITPNNKMMSVHGHFHRLSQGINFPRIHNYVHGGLPKQVVLADCGCGCRSGGRLMSVIVKEFDVAARRAPRIMAII